MRAVAGAILVLAGAVLVGTTNIAEAISREPRNAGYFLGACLAGVGGLVMASRALRRAWDAIPVDAKESRQEVP